MDKVSKLPEAVTYDMRLSDSYEIREGFEELCKTPDLEAVVHMYDFRMTLAETYAYIKDETIPERFDGYQGDLLNYALTANSITYVQSQLRIADSQKVLLPENVTSLPELFRLLINRGIFVDLFKQKEVCDMTVAEFSREGMIRYQSREEGLEEGIEIGREEGLEKGIKITKSVLKLDSEGYAISDIATELNISVEEVKRILED